MSNQWFRSWHGAPTDPKWLGIARKAGVAPGIVAAVVWALLDRASQASERGSIAGYDADGLGYFMGCEPEQIEHIVALMHEKDILADNAFTGWEKHQPKREDGAAERAKQWRERKRTQPNAGEPEQTLDTDTDTDTDTEAEREKEQPRAQDPKHWQEVQDFLKSHAESLTDWETEFLHSVKWKPNLTTAQADSLKGIRGKLKSTGNGGYALPVVLKGTPQFDAWVAYYGRKFDGKIGFYESRDSLTVPTEYPPTMQEQAA